MVIATEKMIRQLKQDPLFIMGFKEGLEQAREQAREIGRKKKAVTCIYLMSEKGFEAKIIAEVLEEPISFVKKIQGQLARKEEIIKLLAKRSDSIEKVAKKLSISPFVVAFVIKQLDK